MYLDRVVSKRPNAPSVHITNVSTFTLMTPLSLRGVFNIYTFRSHFDSRTKSSALLNHYTLFVYSIVLGSILGLERKQNCTTLKTSEL